MNLRNKIAFAIFGAATGAVADRVLNGAWTKVTGEEPPDLADPEIPAQRALTWIVLSAVILATTQIFLNRVGANRWQAKAKPLVVHIGKK